MIPGRRVATDALLELDEESKLQLIGIAARLLPYRQQLDQIWRSVYFLSLAADVRGADDRASGVTSELLDLFFSHVPVGGFEEFYEAIAAKGMQYQETGLPYGHLILAVHHFEQVTLPFLTKTYPQPAQLERAIIAFDRFSDNAIALIASSYFENTLAELRALQQVTDTALSTLDLNPLLESLLERMVEAVGGEVGTLLLRDETSGELRGSSSFGLPKDEDYGPTGDAGQGFASHVMSLGRPAQVADAQVDPLVVDRNIKRAGVGALVGVRLVLGQRVIGTVHVGRRSPRPFAQRETALLALLADRAAAAIDHAQLYQRTAHLLSQTAALQRLTASITAKMALLQILEVVLDGVAEVFGVSRAAIYLQDEQTGELRCPASRRLSTQFIAAVKSRNRPATGTLFHGQYIYSLDVPHDRALDALRPEIDREGIHTVLALPFGHGSDVTGSLCLFHDDVRPYSLEERNLAQTFADQTAIAIANATLYRQIRERAAELDRLNSDLQVLDRMKTDFLAMISHELRTPLTAILGYTDLMLRGSRGPIADRPTEDLKTVRANGERLLNLINDLIDFSSIEAGTVTISPRAVDLTRLLPHVLTAFTPLAEAHSITLTLRLQPDLPPVLGDAAAVEKILTQLLSNAVKFTAPNGAVLVAARAAEPLMDTDSTSPAPAEGRHFVLVTVSDSGIGIPTEQLTRIWDHFYQVDSSSARRFGGSGLGLAIVKRLVERQGGRIWAESRGLAGKGSTFSFLLPFAAEQGLPTVAP